MSGHGDKVKLVRKLWRATKLLNQAGGMMPARDQSSIDHATETVREFVGHKAECDHCEFVTPTILMRKFSTRQGSVLFCPDCRKKFFNRKSIDILYGHQTVRLTTNAWGRFTSVQWFTGDKVDWDAVKTDKTFMRAAYNRLYTTYGPE